MGVKGRCEMKTKTTKVDAFGGLVTFVTVRDVREVPACPIHTVVANPDKCMACQIAAKAPKVTS